jgi:hypothetical protein
MNVSTLAANLVNVIINPLLALLFAFGVLVFIYGMVEFLVGLNFESRHELKENGKRHMIWGLLGMFVMASAYAIITLIAGTVCQGGSLSTCYGTSSGSTSSLNTSTSL